MREKAENHALSRTNLVSIGKHSEVKVFTLLNSEGNYAELYAFLTGETGVNPGTLGPLKTLAPKTVEPLRFAIHNLPFPPNPLFTGRTRELEKLRTELKRQREATTTQPVVIYGFGGVGKTQLAVEYT